MTSTPETCMFSLTVSASVSVSSFTETFIERNRVASSTPSMAFTASRSSGLNPLSE